MEMGTLLYCSMPPGDSPGMGRCHSPSSRAQDGRDSCRCAPWCTESAGAGALDLTQGSFGAKSSTVTFLFPASGCASPGPALHRGRGETAFSGHEGAHKPPTRPVLTPFRCCLRDGACIYPFFNCCFGVSAPTFRSGSQCTSCFTSFQTIFITADVTNTFNLMFFQVPAAAPLRGW